MTTHYIKQFDTEPPIEEILRDGDGNPVDLTLASAVYLHVSTKGHKEIKIKREAIIENAVAGKVRFEFNTDANEGETDIAGAFPREWRIDWGNGRDQRVPNDGDDLLVITKAVTTDDA